MKNPQLEVPVDTHVHRVSKRLGLIDPKVNADQAHTVFAKIAPPEPARRPDPPRPSGLPRPKAKVR